MRAELHSHTYYSRGKQILYDGVEPPERMVRRAKELGIGALAVTDHNTMLGIKDARTAGRKHGVLIIPGEEVSTLHGHTLALGIQEIVRPGLSVFETVDKIHSQGGIAVSVHPFDIKHDGLRQFAGACDAIEVFNGNNVDRISNIRARKFAVRNKMVKVAGSDAHTTAMVGSGTISANATDVDGIIKAIKKNKVQVQYKYPSVRVLKDYAVIKLKMSYNHTSNYIDDNYNSPKRFIAKRALGLVNRSPGRIDRLFDVFTYMTFAGAVTYSVWRNGVRR